jgi:hypothetical protein
MQTEIQPAKKYKKIYGFYQAKNRIKQLNPYICRLVSVVQWIEFWFPVPTI